MMGIRTPPTRKISEPNPKPKAVPSERRSIGERIDEWEAAKASTSVSPSLIKPTKRTIPAERNTRPTPIEDAETSRPHPDRLSEARECLRRAKEQLDMSGNIRRDIKSAVITILNRLYQLVKEADAENKLAQEEQRAKQGQDRDESGVGSVVAAHTTQIGEHARLLQENTKCMEELKEELGKHKEMVERATVAATYASVAASKTAAHSAVARPARETLHSVVVTAKDEMETGENVLERVRKVMDAKEGWLEVMNVRKAKDRKIVIGVKTKTDRENLKKRLESHKEHLNVEEVQNKDPLLVVKGVLSVHSNEEILGALRNQNRELFQDLDEESDRVKIKYRKKARNPHTCHVVLSTSPAIWQRATSRREVRIDLQCLKVEDQTPLVQCTRCLGYGHGKRFCTEPTDVCSHCSGPHLRADCTEFLAGTQPKCRNCTTAKLDNVAHNTFHTACPIREKWDAIARSTVAYC